MVSVFLKMNFLLLALTFKVTLFVKKVENLSASLLSVAETTAYNLYKSLYKGAQFNRETEKPFLKFQFSSVAQSCPTLCDPMNRSTPGLLVHHQLPEFTQTHVHQVSDAIQPSHPLPSPSPPAPNPSQHQSLFQ